MHHNDKNGDSHDLMKSHEITRPNNEFVHLYISWLLYCACDSQSQAQWFPMKM